MNNKGQSLVIFIILIPILFLVFLFIYDYSLYKSEKDKLYNISKDIITSALKYEESNKEKTVKDLYNFNGYNTDNLEVSYNNNELKVHYILKVNTLSNKIIKNNYQEIKINMIAAIENNDIIIKE